MTITFGSLFAGIGGFDLGLERAGMECAWQVEIDDYCRKVLAKHWPHVARYEDVRECGKHNLEPVDLVCGGFPCQDISHAGKRAGIKEGNRSGLWSEFFRIICDLRPRFVLVENVAALFVRGMDVVLGDLAACGYDAEWQCLPAAYFGAPHPRDRIFIVAHPNGQRCQGHEIFTNAKLPMPEKPCRAWATQPPVLRMADGLSIDVDRLRALGNAVVPQVAEWIGRRIMEVEADDD